MKLSGENVEKLTIYIKNIKEPFIFNGEYLGHERPDGKETNNWHYYKDDQGRIYHFRKEHIQFIISG